jgi:hypothetical protein
MSMTSSRTIAPPSSTLSQLRSDQRRRGLRRVRRGNGRQARSWSMWRWPGRRGEHRFWGFVAPDAPAFLRPLLRLLFFNRILKKGVCPKGFKAHKALNPTSGPATPAEARDRLEGALARFDQECRRWAASGQHVVSTGFGTVSVEDLVRFNALHTRHHCKQMPGAT